MELKGIMGKRVAGDGLRLFRIPRIYIETSVINGVFSKDVRIRVVSSVFFDKIRAGEIEGHVSSYVLAELYETPEVNKRGRLLRFAGLCIVDAPSGPKVEELGRKYVRRGMIPRKYIFDAYHIASASIGGFEALVTWNYEHILRDKTEKLLRIVNKELGIYVPRLRSPEVYVW